MRNYDVSYFCEKDQGPIAHIHSDSKKFSDSKWPYTLVLNASTTSIDTPRVIFYIDSLDDLIALKTSIIFQVEKILSEEEPSNG